MMAIGLYHGFCNYYSAYFLLIHFTLVPETGLNPNVERYLHRTFFGFEVLISSKIYRWLFTFGALNWCSVLVIIGATYFLQKD